MAGAQTPAISFSVFDSGRYTQSSTKRAAGPIVNANKPNKNAHESNCRADIHEFVCRSVLGGGSSTVGRPGGNQFIGLKSGAPCRDQRGAFYKYCFSEFERGGVCENGRGQAQRDFGRADAGGIWSGPSARGGES